MSDDIETEKDIIEVPLFSVDFEENTITFKLSEAHINRAWHVGNAKIDISEISK